MCATLKVSSQDVLTVAAMATAQSRQSLLISIWIIFQLYQQILFPVHALPTTFSISALESEATESCITVMALTRLGSGMQDGLTGLLAKWLIRASCSLKLLDRE
jgi:hypothetical protein